ncbi:MAG: cysteine--tRNA ligase [Abditibacteriales bacterium]|nr:cysteine--tRNA ligase [Abditibacteriales bacterium]MDW8365613.1 cysteine--tRNA ligase [Abditibacteriales bacterium]
MKVYNTYTKRLEDFTPREAGKVSMYVCGMTPYDSMHLGHARAFLVYDMMRRYLEWRGFEVTHIQNVTDVDDKIIRRAHELGVSPCALAERFTAESLEDCDALGIVRAHHYPRVTEHIPEIIDLIQRLLDKGFAYVTPSGSVYFRVRAFDRYGQLSGRDVEDLTDAQARIEADPEKEFRGDFALWKAAKPGEPAWDSPWSQGRPGWHIECSAMSTKYLGAGFDIHGGAIELLFPHHENELAQTEAAADVHPCIRYWLHCGIVTINGQKMSKSLGNFLTVKEALAIAPRNVWRMLLMMTDYRTPVDFSTPDRTGSPQEIARRAVMAKLVPARSAWERVQIAVQRADELIRETGKSGNGETVNTPLTQAVRQRFIEAMDNDFGTPAALAVVFDLIGEMNKVIAQVEERRDDTLLAALAGARATVKELLGVLGFSFEEAVTRRADLAPQLIDLLIRVRQRARQEKQYALADYVRSELAALGVVLEDRKDGTTWRQKT